MVDMSHKKDGNEVVQRQALQKFMEKNGLRAAPWARAAGISEGTIRNYLRGLTRSLTYATLERLAEAADTSVDVLVGNQGGGAGERSGERRATAYNMAMANVAFTVDSGSHGMLEEIDGQYELLFRPKRKSDCKNKEYLGVKVEGNSFVGYPDGSELIFEKTNDDSEIENGRLVICEIEENGNIMRFVGKVNYHPTLTTIEYSSKEGQNFRIPYWQQVDLAQNSLSQNINSFATSPTKNKHQASVPANIDNKKILGVLVKSVKNEQ